MSWKLTNPFEITAKCANHSEQSLLSSRQRQPHPRGEDREPITRAREAAEALFTPKPSANPPSIRERASETRKPRVLQMISAAPPNGDDAHEATLVPPAPSGREIPRAEFARIRTWMKYGMTAVQVAQIYGVAITDIERILRKI
jgi:hypothetical protein